MSEVEIPKRLRSRPKFRGMPIPFTTFVNPQTKVPDFKVTNERSWNVCVTRKQCGLCGQLLLKNESYFIGGDRSCTSGIFFDPPMHKECAEYAFKVCPFLACAKGYSKAPPREQKGYTIVVNPHMPTERPNKMGILFCKSWSMVNIQGNRYFKADKIESVEWKD